MSSLRVTLGDPQTRQLERYRYVGSVYDSHPACYDTNYTFLTSLLAVKSPIRLCKEHLLLSPSSHLFQPLPSAYHTQLSIFFMTTRHTRTTRTRGVGGRFTSLVPSHERFCASCKTTSTSQWRTGAEDGRSLCNRCGIRLRRRAESSKSKMIKEQPVLPSMSSFMAEVLPVGMASSDDRTLPGIHTLMPETQHRPHHHHNYQYQYRNHHHHYRNDNSH